MNDHEEHLPLDQTPTVPLPVVRTPTMGDQFKELCIKLLRAAGIGVAVFLAVCAAIAAERLWGDWDAGFWRYAAGAAVVALVAGTVVRTRTRRASRSYARESY